MTHRIDEVLKVVEDYCKAGEPHGCGNWHCKLGCKLEYENVPIPHVYRSFGLWFEHDYEKGWRWEAEGCGYWLNDPDPLVLLNKLMAYLEGENDAGSP